MDITQDQFRKQLLPILKNISTATFITFDFEMSGVTTRPKFGAGDRSHDVGKWTLQQQYEEMKSAAETFQILQVGITCVEEDREREYYLARPYNFNLSPLRAEGVDERIMNLDRKFSFSSSACNFLVSNRFDFGKPFAFGITYLSRDEEVYFRKEHAQVADRNANIPEIVLAPGDPALEFFRGARKMISAWVNNPKPKYSFVNVGNPAGPLNGYQRRLVHQLVRMEFPGYRTFARNNASFMQIVKTDPEEEAKYQLKQSNKFNDAIAKQTGLRWLFEALTNGNLDGIPASWFSEEKDGKPELSQKAIEPTFTLLKAALKKKRHVVVGHNLFTDLGFLYSTFFSELPETVTEFQDKIHQLFPIVFDTKYISTEGQDSMNPREKLNNLLAPFKKIHTPLIVLHESHTSYGGPNKEHEAGYDSWMTAEIFVKLSSKLHAERKRFEDFESEPDTESYGTPEESSHCTVDDEPGGALLDFSDMNGNFHDLSDDLPSAWHAKLLQIINGKGNSFSVLADLGEDLPDQPDQPDQPKEPKLRQWIPVIDSSFWDIYINKLRVDASEGGVCDLNEECE